jgi:hypothetical protein
MFDPSIGNLLSANVVVNMSMNSAMQTHCFGGLITPVFCNTNATIRTGSTALILPSTQVGVNLGTPMSVSTNISFECSDFGFVFDPASCGNGNGQAGITTDVRNLTFAGANAAGFVGTGNLNFTTPVLQPLGVSASHSGFPSLGFFEFLVGTGTGSSAGDLAALLAFLALAVQGDSHTLAWSDAHYVSDYRSSASVTYAYEPRIVSVPEPSTISIFVFGLAGLGFMSRRRRRGAAA